MSIYKKIPVHEHNILNDRRPMKVVDVVNRLQSILHDIPTASREWTYVEMGYRFGNEFAVDLWYERPETDAEKVCRVRSEARRGEYAERMERVELARLLKKYGSK